jgi:hypothetical protein
MQPPAKPADRCPWLGLDSPGRHPNDAESTDSQSLCETTRPRAPAGPCADEGLGEQTRRVCAKRRAHSGRSAPPPATSPGPAAERALSDAPRLTQLATKCGVRPCPTATAGARRSGQPPDDGCTMLDCRDTGGRCLLGSLQRAVTELARRVASGAGTAALAEPPRLPGQWRHPRPGSPAAPHAARPAPCLKAAHQRAVCSVPKPVGTAGRWPLRSDRCRR